MQASQLTICSHPPKNHTFLYLFIFDWEQFQSQHTPLWFIWRMNRMSWNQHVLLFFPLCGVSIFWGIRRNDQHNMTAGGWVHHSTNSSHVMLVATSNAFLYNTTHPCTELPQYRAAVSVCRLERISITALSSKPWTWHVGAVLLYWICADKIHGTL